LLRERLFPLQAGQMNLPLSPVGVNASRWSRIENGMVTVGA
jgi:hypothetical protein